MSSCSGHQSDLVESFYNSLNVLGIASDIGIKGLSDISVVFIEIVCDDEM